MTHSEHKVTAITGGEVPENWKSDTGSTGSNPVDVTSKERKFLVEVLWQGGKDFEYAGTAPMGSLGRLHMDNPHPFVVIIELTSGMLILNRADYKAIRIVESD